MTKKDKKMVDTILEEVNEFFNSYKVTISKLIDVPVSKVDINTFSDGLSMLIGQAYEESLSNKSMFDSEEVIIFRTKLGQLTTLQLTDFKAYSNLIKKQPIVLNFIGIMFHIEGEILDKLYSNNK